MKLTLVAAEQVARAFQKAGWNLARWRGSHMIFTKAGEEATLSIPDHKELGRCLLRALVRDARLTIDDFTDLL